MIVPLPDGRRASPALRPTPAAAAEMMIESPRSLPRTDFSVTTHHAADSVCTPAAEGSGRAPAARRYRLPWDLHDLRSALGQAMHGSKCTIGGPTAGEKLLQSPCSPPLICHSQYSRSSANVRPFAPRIIEASDVGQLRGARPCGSRATGRRPGT